MKNITAIILAAGEGKRIKPIVTPKGLLPFLGQPIINWIIDDLKAAGLEKFVVITSKDKAKAYQSVLSDKQIKFAVQSKPTGMADAVLAASDKIDSDSILVVNAVDIFSPQLFKDFLNQVKLTTPDILLTGLKTDQYLPGGYFKLEGKQVKAIIEKPGEGKQPSLYANLVIHYFKNSSEFIDQLKSTTSKADDVYEVALSKLLKDKPADFFEYQDYFSQLKYPHQIIDVMNDFLKHRLTKPFIHPTAKVMQGAIIKNSYIGKNVIVGNNALVRDSIVEEGSVVGYNTEITRSYVGPKNFFHCNYIGDSIIEAESNLGSGARLANFRFDGKTIADTNKTKFGAVLAKGAKLGINTSIMPGIHIGANALIGAGIILNHHVAANDKVLHFHGSKKT